VFYPVTYQVTLVEQQQQVLVAGILAYVLLQELAARALRISRIQHLNSSNANNGREAATLSATAGIEASSMHVAC
jgi:hypothetical protein